MKKILIFLSKGVEILELAPFIDVFGWNSVVGDKENLIEVKTFSLRENIRCTWTLEIKPQIVIFEEEEIEIDQYDALIIPGGFGMSGFFKDGKDIRIQNIIKKFIEKKKIVIGICTGAILLGEAGVLENKKATTYFLDNERYFKQLNNFKAIPTKEKIVKDENIFTTANPESALEMAFILLEILTNKKNMDLVKLNMGYKI